MVHSGGGIASLLENPVKLYFFHASPAAMPRMHVEFGGSLGYTPDRSATYIPFQVQSAVLPSTFYSRD